MNNRWRDALRVILFALIFTVCTLLGTYASILSPVFIIICTILFANLASRSGMAKALLSAALSMLVLMLVFYNPLLGLIATLSYLLTGVVLAFAVKKQYGFGRVFLSLMIAYLIYIFISFYLSLYTQGITVAQFFTNIMEQVREFYTQAAAQYQNTPAVADTFHAFLEQFDKLAQAVLQIIPVMFIIWAAIFSYILLFFARRRFTGLNLSHLPAFSMIRLDKSYAYLFLITYLCYLFISNAVFQTVFLNLTILFCALFIVCGFTFADYFMKEKGLGMVLRRFILIALLILCLSSIASMAMLFLGFADTTINFRKWMEIKNNQKIQK